MVWTCSRLGGFLALAVVALADRRGRRVVLLWASVTGCTLAVSGALAPSLAWLTASQTVARGFATALLLLVGIVAAEEVPARTRAYAVSLLAMAGGFTDYAARDSIVVLRQEGATTRRIPFEFDKLTAKSGAKNGGQENFCVAPGDIILVP